ncbi:MAG: DUF167 domain-containing protein [Planctomycetaceae bacterium]|nr:DUF167 domain-containing protein [Planctomycetaceae bacterium]
MITLTETAEGVLLAVTAQPGARREGVVGAHNGRLKVAVTQAAEKGKANAQIVQVLADSLQLKRSQLQLRSGVTSRQKTFLVRDVSRLELQSRLDRFVPPE